MEVGGLEELNRDDETKILGRFYVKNLRNTTSQKLRSIKTVIKQLINYKIEQVFCLSYYKIQQVVGVGLLARVVGWSSLLNDLFCWVQLD